MYLGPSLWRGGYIAINAAIATPLLRGLCFLSEVLL